MFFKGRVILICCSLSPVWLGNINKMIPVNLVLTTSSVSHNLRAGNIAKGTEDLSTIHARACGANPDREDARVLQGYAYGGANAICVPELFRHRANGYDAHRNVDGSEYAP